MKPVPRSHQHHDLYRKYHGQNSEISGLRGECGLRIDSLRPSLLRFSDAAQHALGRSDAYRNILEVIKRYHSECEKPITEINYAILYGYGIELQYAYDSLLADIVNGETPELSADQRAPMESLLQLHGPFILASKDGRELVTDAERYARSPQEEKEFQVAINELGNEIACNPDVVAADTARVLNELKAVPDGAKQYERWYRLNRGAFRNFVIVAAGASVAATLAAAASTGSPLLIIAGAVASWISFEGIKKSKSYGKGLSRCPRFRWHAAGSRHIMGHGPAICLPDRLPASVSGRSELRALSVRAALA